MKDLKGLILAINIWKSYMCTSVQETNIESILAVMNRYLKNGLKKIQVRTGFEPMTSAIPV